MFMDEGTGLPTNFSQIVAFTDLRKSILSKICARFLPRPGFGRYPHFCVTEQLFSIYNNLKFRIQNSPSLFLKLSSAFSEVLTVFEAFGMITGLVSDSVIEARADSNSDLDGASSPLIST